jgi:predicted NAD/FAD-binding protein
LHYTHPCYTFASLATQQELPTLNGPRHTFFCGSYFGYGFHEDAVKSAIAVGHAFGLELEQKSQSATRPVAVSDNESVFA